MPPVAARQIRDQAREAAIEKLSARRVDAEKVSVSMVVDVADEHTLEHPASSRSQGSQESHGVSAAAAAARDNVEGQGFLSPEYGDDFDSGSDAVAQHVSVFMGANNGSAERQSECCDNVSNRDTDQASHTSVSELLRLSRQS